MKTIKEAIINRLTLIHGLNEPVNRAERRTK